MLLAVVVELRATATADLNDFLASRHGDVRVIKVPTCAASATHGRTTAAATNYQNVHKPALMNG